jgi:hypothetical protein
MFSTFCGDGFMFFELSVSNSNGKNRITENQPWLFGMMEMDGRLGEMISSADDTK